MDDLEKRFEYSEDCGLSKFSFYLESILAVRKSAKGLKPEDYLHISKSEYYRIKFTENGHVPTEKMLIKICSQLRDATAEERVALFFIGKFCYYFDSFSKYNEVLKKLICQEQ